jgi:hypothetical protein
MQHDIGIAIAEIETSGELRCGAVELLQRLCEVSPNQPASVTPERHPPPTQQPLERQARIRAAR